LAEIVDDLIARDELETAGMLLFVDATRYGTPRTLAGTLNIAYFVTEVNMAKLLANMSSAERKRTFFDSLAALKEEDLKPAYLDREGVEWFMHLFSALNSYFDHETSSNKSLACETLSALMSAGGAQKCLAERVIHHAGRLDAEDPVYGRYHDILVEIESLSEPAHDRLLAIFLGRETPGKLGETSAPKNASAIIRVQEGDRRIALSDASRAQFLKCAKTTFMLSNDNKGTMPLKFFAISVAATTLATLPLVFWSIWFVVGTLWLSAIILPLTRSISHKYFKGKLESMLEQMNEDQIADAMRGCPEKYASTSLDIIFDLFGSKKHSSICAKIDARRKGEE
jgi:hypothetical protein